MKEQAKIRVRTQRFLQLIEVPVISETDQESITYPIVNGVMLVPLKDAHRFNLSSSTLRKMVKKGELTAYEQDGTIRAANARTDIYWNPYDFYNNKRR